jgi:hypothetical protein
MVAVTQHQIPRTAHRRAVAVLDIFILQVASFLL